MGLGERYRRGWASDRYSTRTWYLGCVAFVAYIAIGVWLVLSDVNTAVRVFGGLLALISIAPALVAFRQAHRASRN